MIHPMPDRRQFLRLAAATATTLWLPRNAWSRVPSLGGQDPFALGVASGSPEPDGVVLWTRLLFATLQGQDVTLRWEVAHDDAFTRIARSGQVQAVAALGHAAHVEVQGLEPDRWYFYRFLLGDVVRGEAVSPVGRTRTAPAPGAVVQRLRMAYASCQRWEHGYYAAWRDLRAAAPDLVLFLGDYIYEYPGAQHAVRAVTGGWVLTLDDYRQRYALHKSDADLQAMHAACPWVVTWDDHEVQNDYAGLHEGSGVPVLGTVADFPARRAAAYQAWYEHMPVRAALLTQGVAGLGRGAEMRVYQPLAWGQLLNLQLLDGRQYRDVQACRQSGATIDPKQCEEWSDTRRSYLGMAQEQWLDQALARSGGRWNVIGQQTLFGPRDTRPGPGQRFWTDGWDGYPAARARLLAALQRQRVSNPVFLGGDVHQNWVGHVQADYADPRSAALGVEFCGTSISSRSESTPEKTQAVLAENPHFVFGDAQHRGYGLAEFTPERLTTTLRAVQDPTRADSGVFTLAQFEVREGRARIERAA